MTATEALNAHEFLQHLPGWIMPDARRRGIHRTYLQTLQHLANAGDLDDAGHIVDIRGGSGLARRCNISYRTLQRHIRKLLYNGYIVVTWVASPESQQPRERWNWYAIPSHRGALDQQAMTPAPVSQMVVAGELDRRGQPKRVPVRVREGGQGTLWLERSSPGSCRPPPRQDDVPPTTSCRTSWSSPSPAPKVSKHHGHGARGACAPGSRRGRHRADAWLTGVSEADLRDNGRLDELLRRAVSQRVGRFAGVDPADERTRLAWYAMAEHCLRLGDSPAALFAANVSKDLAFGWISDDDEQRALARLKPRRKPAPEPRAPAAAARVRPVLSTDARWVKEAMALAHRNGTAAWPLLERRGWDRDRYEAALRQLKGAGCI